MKNLIMGVATGYSWHKLEPFINSFNRHAQNTDLILFVDNISNFTRDALIKNNVELLPISDEFKSSLIVNARWAIYKKFLDERGKNYRQVFVTDIRDVIFQGNIFATYENFSNYLGYAVEEGAIRPVDKEPVDWIWIKNFFGEEEANKLANKPAICCGTVIADVESMKKFSVEMYKILVKSSAWGDEQATMNYLVYEKLLPIDELIKIDTQTGDILTLALTDNPATKENFILRGDGGIPAVVHQYDRHKNLAELVNKIYRDKNFQFDEKFTDTYSLLDQILKLATLGKIDDAYKIFTRYLFGGNFEGQINNLINLWELTLQNITPAAELLMLSIQAAIISVKGNVFNLGQVNKINSYTNLCMKNNIAVNFPFKLFLENLLLSLANQFYAAKQLENALFFLNSAENLGTPKDSNFYLFQSKVYRESDKKAEALAAYEKALG